MHTNDRNVLNTTHNLGPLTAKNQITAASYLNCSGQLNHRTNNILYGTEWHRIHAHMTSYVDLEALLTYIMQSHIHIDESGRTKNRVKKTEQNRCTVYAICTHEQFSPKSINKYHKLQVDMMLMCRMNSHDMLRMLQFF